MSCHARFSSDLSNILILTYPRLHYHRQMVDDIYFNILEGVTMLVNILFTYPILSTLLTRANLMNHTFWPRKRIGLENCFEKKFMYTYFCRKLVDRRRVWLHTFYLTFLFLLWRFCFAQFVCCINISIYLSILLLVLILIFKTL